METSLPDRSRLNPLIHTVGARARVRATLVFFSLLRGVANLSSLRYESGSGHAAHPALTIVTVIVKARITKSFVVPDSVFRHLDRAVHLGSLSPSIQSTTKIEVGICIINVIPP